MIRSFLAVAFTCLVLGFAASTASAGPAPRTTAGVTTATDGMVTEVRRHHRKHRHCRHHRHSRRTCWWS
jgi:hypothetical protein